MEIGGARNLHVQDLPGRLRPVDARGKPAVISPRCIRHTVAEVCQESRNLLHPVKPEEKSLETMSEQRRDNLQTGLTWGWDCCAGWDWFNGDLDSIFLPETVLWSDQGLEALDVLDRIVGPVQHVLVPWDLESHGRVLSQTNYPSALINLTELQTVGFVMATRRLKRCARTRWTVLPYALDIDNEDNVKDVLAILGDDAEFFRRDLPTLSPVVRCRRPTRCPVLGSVQAMSSERMDGRAEKLGDG